MTSAVISATLQLINNNGAPNVKCTSCVVQMGGFDIKVHGGASWLYNELIKLFKGKIENSVKNAIEATGCATIESCECCIVFEPASSLSLIIFVFVFFVNFFCFVRQR